MDDVQNTSREQAADNNSGQASSVFLFVENLPRLVDKGEILSDFKLTQNGLFLAEDKIEQVLKLYQEWLKCLTLRDSVKSDKKCKRSLFGSEAPEQYYLLEGKKSIPGYLIPCTAGKLQSSPFPKYRGVPLKADSALYATDPIFDRLRDVSAANTAAGLAVTVQIGKKPYRFTVERLKEFSALSGNSATISRHFNGSSSLREVLPVFIRMLGKSRPAFRRRLLLVPSRFKNSKKIRYRVFGPLVFVVNEKMEITACYERRGKNLYDFIQAELAGGKKSLKSLPGVELLSKNQRLVGEIKIYTRRYKLAVTGFAGFIRDIEKTRPYFKNLPFLFDWKDALRSFIDLMEYSESVQVPVKYGRRAGKRAGRERMHYRKSRNWIISVNAKGVITNCRIEK